MHDGIEIEKRGKPAVVICTDRFVNMGRASAEAAGIPDYRFAVLPHPIGRLPEDELRRRAEEALTQVVELLVAR